ncbi:aminotransferase class V-fold PLP-dependent enzyme [Mycoplasmopsis caviae]|uniref:Aminotransferase class V-fold PLP-dependent enzyme n=1 Tax=Mycoplasmopsis caviae TaxID=55603 RepID=A0A3P8MEG7_9BACT|nr:aminotransferase class V-fold PLP-dependent enzyme [Mycoplasmopsis caviae]UUD35520.1 aminotransferase class V-fold PLP-dependent enzyme [Mycoplasmopsis caviae]VDR41706.1 Soluble hydrogenase 42 kDa subunit [Mycoplasmopsis caviae]
MQKVDNAIIFAAGKGTRMSPLTQYTPKPLIKVFGEHMIERNIKFLIESGIKKIYVVVGYLAEQFEFLKEKYPNLTIIKNDSYDVTNNISSLFVSKEFWSNTLYMDGDIYLRENIFPKLIELIKKNKTSIAFSQIYKKHSPEWSYKTDPNNFVKFHELEKDAFNMNVWSGFLYLNKKTSDEVKHKLDVFYEKNKQSYLESFFWTLENKFKHVALDDVEIDELDSFDDLISIDSSYKSHQNTILFTPGPVNNFDEVTSILGESVIHHHSQLFSYYMSETTKLMKEFFKTESGLPLFLTASATGVMEAMALNSVEKGDRVLVIEAGDFGKRMEIILRKILDDSDLCVLSYPDGQTYNLSEVENTIRNNKFKSIFITHHETSTGVLHDIKKISDLIQKYCPETLFLVDTVSSFIHEEIEFDKWKIDAALATSGKGFCVMPGLSCIVLSERMQQVVKKNKNVKFYFDLASYIKYYEEQHSTPYTPASSILIALNASLKVMKNLTLKKMNERRKQIYEYIRSVLVDDLGFKDAVSSNSITHGLLVLNLPNGYDAEILRNSIEYKENIYFELGRAERRHSQIRIGIPNTINMRKAVFLVEKIKEHLEEAKI